MKNKELFVVIPAFNEQTHIRQVVNEVKKYIALDNIIIIDDGSKDKTYEEALDSGAIILRHIVNLGKGNALKTGCDYALRKNAKKIIVMDSDTQHDPAELPLFIEKLKNYDIIFGYRDFTKDMPFVMSWGNRFISTSFYLLFGIKIKDTQSGYRAFTIDAYKKIRWQSTGYTVESEMIANTGKTHLKYTQVPIKTIYFDNHKGTTIFDGVKIVINMFIWKILKQY